MISAAALVGESVAGIHGALPVGDVSQVEGLLHFPVALDLKWSPPEDELAGSPTAKLLKEVMPFATIEVVNCEDTAG